MSAELDFDFKLAFGELNKRIDTFLSTYKNPVHKQIGASGTSTGPGNVMTLIANDNPSAGKAWFVARFFIRGTDGHTAVGGAIADVYAGPGEEDNALAQIYSGISIPFLAEEGRFHNPMHQNDQLYALIYNVPAAQNITMAATVWEYPVEAVESLVL